MAELINHSIIEEPDLYDELASSQAPVTAPQLARSIQVKIDVVEQDPFGGVRRAVPTLGTPRPTAWSD